MKSQTFTLALIIAVIGSTLQAVPQPITLAAPPALMLKTGLKNGLHDITGEKIRTCLLNSGILVYSINSILVNGNYSLFSFGWLLGSIYEMSFSCQYIVYANPTLECAKAIKDMSGDFLSGLKSAIYNRDVIEIGKNLYKVRTNLQTVNTKCVDLNRTDFYDMIKAGDDKTPAVAKRF